MSPGTVDPVTSPTAPPTTGVLLAYEDAIQSVEHARAAMRAHRQEIRTEIAKLQALDAEYTARLGPEAIPPAEPPKPARATGVTEAVRNAMTPPCSENAAGVRAPDWLAGTWMSWAQEHGYKPATVLKAVHMVRRDCQLPRLPKLGNAEVAG